MSDYSEMPDVIPQPKETAIKSEQTLPQISENDTFNTPSTSEVREIPSGRKTTAYRATEELREKPTSPCCMLEKLEKAAPYNIFFNTIIKAPETLTQPNAITFTDLLCSSLGELKCSLQINFMVDIKWLLEQYKARNLHEKPLTVVYGYDWPDMTEFIDQFCPNVKYKLVEMKELYGVHHSKVGVYIYEDLSLRVAVSTANLYYEDWNHYNQTLWLSPKCPRLPDAASDTDGESVTGFKSTFLNYLEHYKLTHLESFIEYVKRADFTAVRVFLVYSVPGKHSSYSTGSHLHRVSNLLSRHCVLPDSTKLRKGSLSWSIIAQASSIGLMGKSSAEWLRGTLLRCLASCKNNPFPRNSQAILKIVYPTLDNVMSGYFGLESGGCLCYYKNLYEQQMWFHSYFYQWKASAYGRTEAMPHLKSYCRISPCLTQLAYYLLTSANISRSAWGLPFSKYNSTYVRSYEVGVMFLPKFFDEEYFEIKKTLNSKNKTLFPFMYNLPLIPYGNNDYPWCNSSE